ncbi:PLD nuclease N-terminal domain-containing protein [Enterococcus pseudoavium]|uniref:PLD nuclease N-terminal domain-containing protein n=1 Tax=Enterococcus pseudoavium TaxID=44007 RepID=A0ABU3FJR9_9ENTE|nr:PLD nuclease N-terminal domain-containing protein [Enterococcus pseudoavium]MDT2753700.1 PLD nuclease N-terminal domain-containing protein [Enterococcus pseudoavium]MDT2771283.1 PLD nuclease N-terminal domain-containing protein [Enterococcus pseudoavium]REC31637.1 hypothetical protein CF160_03915 [Enterococcus pseudoavium]
MHNFELFKENLALFIPLIILELLLMITAVRHILKHPTYRFGNKAFWLVIVIVFQLIGPVIYFVFGRRDNG